MNNITPIEALITDTVQKFETDLCRAVAKAYGAPAEFFTGKSEKEIMEGLATLLKMHMEAVNLARKILRKDR